MRDLIEIKSSTIANRFSPYIIAEMACAHNGSIEQAKALIDAAVTAKADAIQLQFFVAKETVTPHHEAYEIIKSIEFSPDIWKKLVAYAKNKGIHVWACTYDVPSVELAKDCQCEGIKLNSADLSNPDVLKAVAKTGVPFTLGTGASTREEIAQGLKTLDFFGARECILMHGVQNFPTAIEDLHINRLEWLMGNFPNIPVGYADHTNGDSSYAPIVDLLAMAKGAALLEKHITLDRSLKGIDYQAALEPEEFELYVKQIKSTYNALGSNEEKAFSESDLRYRKFQKKSIVAARELNEGDLITREDVLFIRNVEPGLPPDGFDLINSKKLKVAMSKFQNINLSDVDLG